MMPEQDSKVTQENQRFHSFTDKEKEQRRGCFAFFASALLMNGAAVWIFHSTNAGILGMMSSFSCYYGMSYCAHLKNRRILQNILSPEIKIPQISGRSR